MAAPSHLLAVLSQSQLPGPRVLPICWTSEATFLLVVVSVHADGNVAISGLVAPQIMDQLNVSEPVK